MFIESSTSVPQILQKIFRYYVKEKITWRQNVSTDADAFEAIFLGVNVMVSPIYRIVTATASDRIYRIEVIITTFLFLKALTINGHKD